VDRVRGKDRRNYKTLCCRPYPACKVPSPRRASHCNLDEVGDMPTGKSAKRKRFVKDIGPVSNFVRILLEISKSIFMTFMLLGILVVHNCMQDFMN
jgi:hypothetical protein